MTDITQQALCHNIPLRSGAYMAQVVIPANLSKSEADRLCAFVASLAQPDAHVAAPLAVEDSRETSSDAALSAWYAANPPPSMSMCANSTDYWRAMYEHREKEAHELSEEIIRLRAAMAAASSGKEN